MAFSRLTTVTGLLIEGGFNLDRLKKLSNAPGFNNRKKHDNLLLRLCKLTEKKAVENGILPPIRDDPPLPSRSSQKEKECSSNVNGDGPVVSFL